MDLLQTVSPILDRRLRPASPAPLAVGLSGGGDSLALLLITKAWADARGRSVIALTVDHGLNPASADWTERCRETTARLGVAFQALVWTGDKPAAGLPASARAARHALLADAARAAGARVLLMGHTADDLSESAAMRAEGSTVPDAREWGPSPAWPEGRDVFLLRPLLGVGRAALRAFLLEAGERWIDDPANADVRYARARARLSRSSPAKLGRGTAGGGGGESVRRLPSTTLRVVPLPNPSDWGGLTLPLSTTPTTLAMAGLCAAGTARPPRGESLSRIIDGLRRGDPFVASLAGARIEADWTELRVMREAGEITRRGRPPLALPPGQAVVWDGRFELTATRPGLTVQALSGLATRLPDAEQRRLKSIPAAARPALPVISDGEGRVSCPILAERPSTHVRALALDRFEAATGRVDSEPAP
ncbi:MAG: tRNA lysidine(34) synthetase TilS [Caulobacter sp.]|nr:tRNA lysidine(34) synthetase TilS [Caulobacter sp.]